MLSVRSTKLSTASVKIASHPVHELLGHSGARQPSSLSTVLPQVWHQQAQQRVLQEQDDGGRAAVVLQVLLQDHSGAVPRQEAGGGAGLRRCRHVSLHLVLGFWCGQSRLGVSSCIRVCVAERSSSCGGLPAPMSPSAHAGHGLQRHCKTRVHSHLCACPIRVHFESISVTGPQAERSALPGGARAAAAGRGGAGGGAAAGGPGDARDRRCCRRG
jgi:hypothetical protein